ncbi:MAG: hypothetical protein R6V84_05890 [Desulfobacterales bacterium]
MTTDSLRQRKLAGAFVFGWVFFNYPIFSLFNLPMARAGVPLLYGYVFLLWAALIGLIMLAARPDPPPAGCGR